MKKKAMTGRSSSAEMRQITLAPELDEAVGFWIRRAVSIADDLFNEHFSSLEISTQQYAIMMTIRHNPGCQPSALSALLKITPNNLVPQIDNLVRRGLIRRSSSTTDRRIRHLRLTPTGLRFVEELAERHAAVRQSVDARLATECPEELRRMLKLYVDAQAD